MHSRHKDDETRRQSMSVNIEQLWGQAVAVDEQTVKARLAAKPARETTGGFVVELLDRFEASGEASIWLPVSAFGPGRKSDEHPEGAPREAKTLAQNFNSKAREANRGVTADALANDDGEPGIVLYRSDGPKPKSTRGRKPKNDEQPEAPTEEENTGRGRRNR
jgi:hypothetical protein